MKGYSDLAHVNVGSGTDLPILELAHIVSEVVGFKGRIVCDDTKPDGTPRKLMSAAKLERLGWRPRISLHDGLAQAYHWFVEHHAAAGFV
jgi:GDP-L-fucose synthase